MHSRKDRRFLCTACRKTFSASKGTAFYRLHTAAETVSLVITLMAHGCPLQTIVVAFGYDERTVAQWMVCFRSACVNFALLWPTVILRTCTDMNPMTWRRS